MFEQERRDIINKLIAEFCSEVVREPLCFFSEADLQGMLYRKLAIGYPKMYETSFLRGPKSTGRYKTGCVHREYGVGSNRRMDIVILPPEEVARIDSPNLTVEGKYISPKFGFELGTEKTADTAKHLKNDVMKLEKVSGHGYGIYFFRDCASAAMGTKSRLNIEGRINDAIRAPIKGQEIKDNMTLICILLRLARREKRIWGKCETFDYKSGNWKKINLTEARKEIEELLSPASIS